MKNQALPKLKYQWLINESQISNLCVEFSETILYSKYQNPPKITLELSKHPQTNEVINYCNLMGAVDNKGNYCSKTITIDNKTNKSKSLLQLFNKNHKLLFKGDFLELTRWRCAILVASVLRQFAEEAPRITIIGLGNMAQVIIATILSIKPKAIITLHIRSSAESVNAFIRDCMASHKLINHFNNSNIKPAVSYLNSISKHTNFIISCTSAESNAKVITSSLIQEKGCNPKFISFDGGYIVGPGIRNLFDSYTDSPLQTNNNNAKGDIFPHDEPIYKFPKTKSIKHLFKSHNFTNPNATWSLYIEGMAIFDLVLARYISELKR